MNYLQILCKTFFKLKVTTIMLVMRPAFSSRNIKTVRYGLQTISYMAPKMWDLVPFEMKLVTTLNEVKVKSKSGS